MKKIVLLLICSLFSVCSFAQLPGWSYVQPITITNNATAAMVNYQMPIIINTQALIAANQMKPDGSDIRFGSVCSGGTLYQHYLDSGINTNATRIFVKIPSLAPAASMTIYMFYGNPTATSTSTLTIFNGPYSSTNQVSGGTTNTVSACQRGFRFSPNTDILVTQFGRNTPDATTRYVTIFNYTTTNIVRQMQVAGTASTYTYSNLTQPVWLTQNTQYLLELFNGTNDMYYYQTSSQINSNLTYYDMRYCNSCTQTTFPTTVLTTYHYGYPDFNFYTRNTLATAPTFAIGGGNGGISAQPKDTTVCINSPALFKATFGNGVTYYQWQVNTGSGWTNITNSSVYQADTSRLYLFSATAAMNGYQYRLKYAGACGIDSSVIVTLHTVSSITPTVSIAVSPTSQICNSGSASFAATFTNPGLAPAFQWKKNGTNITGATNTTYTGTGFANGDVVTLTFTSSLTCATPATITSNAIIMGVLPPVLTSDSSFCQFSQPPVITTAGTNVKWYTVPTGGTASSLAPVPSTFTAGTLTYYITQTINGCESNRKPIHITIKPKPAPPTVTTPVRYCQNDVPMPLTAFGQNLLWYDFATGGQGSPQVPIPDAQYVDTTSYWVTQTINGCESDRSLLNVTVNIKPNGIVLATRPYVCQYDTMTLYYYGNALLSYEYDWKVPAALATIIDTLDTNKLDIVVKFDSAGSTPVRMQVNNNGCLSDEFIYSVQVRPVAKLRIQAPDDVCIGDESIISLDRSDLKVDSFTWNFDGASVAYGSVEGPYGVKWNNSGQHVISVTGTTNECTSPLFTDTVDVHPVPDASITIPEKTNVCAGDTILFEALNYVKGIQYHWSPDYFFSNNDSAAIYGIVTRGGYIKLTATDSIGCTASDSTLLNATPCCSVYLPNAFTPNGDGRNDIFRLVTLSAQSISSFRIINRWGKVIYETSDFKQGWNGTSGGALQETGVYHYFVRYKCSDGNFYEKKGDVTLLR